MTEVDTVFMSHIDDFTAAAEILWLNGESLVGSQESEYRWEIHPAHPERDINSPVFLNYFTEEQWQIVSDAYYLTDSPIVTYYQDSYTYMREEDPDFCIAPCIVFYNIAMDSNNKYILVSYEYIKPTPGSAADQEEAINYMVNVQSRSEDEWVKLNAEYWYKGIYWFGENEI